MGSGVPARPEGLRFVAAGHAFLLQHFPAGGKVRRLAAGTHIVNGEWGVIDGLLTPAREIDGMSTQAQPVSAPERRSEDRAPQPIPATTVRRLGIEDDDAFASDKVRYMYAWWHRAAGGLPPYWSQFDVTDHARIVANAFLVKRLAARSWFFTVKGEAVHALFPSYKTPHEIALREDRESAQALTDYYEEIASCGRCHLVRGILVNDRNEVVEFEAVDCPFREEDSGRIAILGVIEQIRVRPPFLE